MVDKLPTIKDEDELIKLQDVICTLLSENDEAIENVDFQYHQLLKNLDQIDAFFSSSCKESLKKDFDARMNRLIENMIDLQEYYRKILRHREELLERDLYENLNTPSSPASDLKRRATVAGSLNLKEKSIQQHHSSISPGFSLNAASRFSLLSSRLLLSFT